MVRSLLFAALVAAPALVLADPPAGQIDPTFGGGVVNNGVAGLQLAGFNTGDWNDYAYAMAEDEQGRLIVAGAADTDDGVCMGLMRFTADGELDTNGFGKPAAEGKTKGKICHPVSGFGSYLGNDFDIAVLPDGGFFVAGFVSHPFVCRFQSGGEKADGFGGGTGCISIPQIQSQSWPAPVLLVHGTSLLIVTNHTVGMNGVPVLARISLESGSTEPFGAESFIRLLPTEASAFAWDAVLTVDDNIMLSGNIESDPFDVDAFVARFDLQQLQPDSAFSGDGMESFKFNLAPGGQDYFEAIALLPDGNIVAAGDIDMPGGRDGLAVVQLDAASGAMSSTFNGGLPKTYDPCSALPVGCEYLFVNNVAWAAGNIVVSGDADNAMFAARLTESGSVDMGFGQQGLARVDLDEVSGWGYGAMGMVMQGERIILAGPADSGDGDSDFALLRLSGGRLFSDQFEADTP